MGLILRVSLACHECHATGVRQDQSKDASDLAVCDAAGLVRGLKQAGAQAGHWFVCQHSDWAVLRWGVLQRPRALQLQSRQQLPPPWTYGAPVLCVPSLAGLETRSSPAEAACPEVSLGVYLTRVP